MDIHRLLLIHFIVSSAATAYFDHDTNSERSLIKQLLSNYSTMGRPVRDWRKIVEVTVNPQIYTLVSVNEQQEQIKLLLWFPQSWNDEYLRWSPSDWNGMERVNIPASMIWLPDGYIFNTVEVTEPLTNLNARIRSDGTVEVDFNKLVDVTCQMNVVDFPFDEQNCSLQFGSWSYQIDQLTYLPYISPNSSIPKNTNSEWDILEFYFVKRLEAYAGANGEETNKYEETIFILRIRRRPFYYIVVILLPTFVIVTVSVVGIFTPHGVQGDREEKVSLGLTTLLTMAVILDMVTGEMPKSSDGLPLLGRFVLAQIVISVLAIAVSVLTIFAHERVLYLGQNPPPFVYQMFKDEEESISESKPLLLSPCINELRTCLDELRAYLTRQEREEGIRVKWQRFFSWVDITAMGLLVTLNVILTLVMFWHVL